MKRFAENGYVITADGNRIVFLDRRTWGLGWSMVVLGVLVVLLIASTLLNTSGLREIQTNLVAVALPTTTALLLVVIWLIARAYRKRKNQPQEEIQSVLIANLTSQALHDRLGQTVVPLEDVTARMHIDWWTRGTMRIVDLRWSGSQRTIYRSFRRQRCLDLLTFLQEQGLDAH